MVFFKKNIFWRMGTMGREPQISEKDIFGAGDFHSSAAKRANGMIFRIGILPSTRSIQNLIKTLWFYGVFQQKAFSGGWTDGRTDERTGGRTDGRPDVRADGRTDGRAD